MGAALGVVVAGEAACVGEGARLVAQTGGALTALIGQVAEINLLAAEIAASAREQAVGLAEVNVAVNQMDQTTQQNAAMVEEATAAARSLAEEADELSRQVARFALTNGQQRTVAAPTVVHQLQARAATAGREIARNAKRRVAAGGGGASAAVAEDDWSEF